MCNHRYTNEVIANLRAMTTVKRLELSDVSSPMLESLSMDEAFLSPQELNTTVTAYKMGYFDYPRRADLTELAKCLELSKGTAHEYLRKGVLKVIRKEFGLP
jgi:predicted DNA binding protein